jgi:hypothetical protein
MLRATLAGLAAILLALPAQSATIRVPEDEPTILAAVAAAVSGDTVEVACGTYYEHNIFVGANILIRSETGDPSCVTINAQSLGRSMSSGGDATIRGLTFTAGSLAGDGGGYYCYSGSSTLSNCVITGNAADRGGGVYVRGGSSLTLQNCTISNNIATVVRGDGGGVHCTVGSTTVLDGCDISANSAFNDGGGLFASQATLTLSSCTFVGNGAVRGGGLTVLRPVTATVQGCKFTSNTSTQGGAAYGLDNQQPASPMLFSDCEFYRNHAGEGGAVHIDTPVFGCINPLIDFLGCTFRENTAADGGALRLRSVARISSCYFDTNVCTVGMWGGGAASITHCSPTITFCTFNNNQADRTHGGALSLWGSSATIAGCTFVGNGSVAPGAGGSVRVAYGTITLSESVIAFGSSGEPIHCYTDGAATLACCDLFGNVGGDWMGCISGQETLNGNLSVDPLFCNVLSGNFGVAGDSPLLPGNNSCGVLIGAQGQGCGPVALAPETWARIKAGYR